MSPAADRLEHLLLDQILAGRRHARSIFVLLAGCGALALLIPEEYGFSWAVKLAVLGVSLVCGAGFALPSPTGGTASRSGCAGPRTANEPAAGLRPQRRRLDASRTDVACVAGAPGGGGTGGAP